MSRKTKFNLQLSLALLVLVASGPAISQQAPSQQRGLSADTAYQLGVVDHVNLFNGGLTLTIPLGPSYPISSTLNFSLSATYSSNGWDYEEQQCQVVSQLETYEHGIESKHTNVAFGWRVQLGKIIENTPHFSALQYLSPDGSQHGFYPELHPGTGSTGNVWYSNNSTYMRLRFRPNGNTCTGSGACYQLHFPDGTVHEFKDLGTGTAEEPEWLLTRMTDSFGFNHWVEVDYSTAGQWKITDSHGRAHTVFFTAGGRVAKVQVARFGTTAKSEYNFVTTATTIGVQNLPFTPACDGDPPPQSVTVPLLTQLTLPDGSAYRMEYHDSWDPPDVLSGGIARLRLPTGGEFKWAYTPIDFKSQSTTLFGEFVGQAFGVAKKEMFTTFDNAATKTGEWNYDYLTVGNPVPPGDPLDPPCFHTTTVTDPNGDATVNYFDSAESGFSRWQYGLPFRRCDDDGNSLAGDADFLSQEIYAGDAETGTKLRSIYLAYDSDGRDAGFQQEKNHRLRLRRTVYHDDGDRFRQTEFSDFDGLGQYRQTTTTGNFSGSESRTVTTSYNPGSGTLRIDPENSQLLPQNTFNLPGVNAPWVLGTFTERAVMQGGDTAKEEFCFQTTTGFLERTRMLAATDRQPIDVVKVFKQEVIGSSGTGFVESERAYGGDNMPLTTDEDLCNLTLPSKPQSHLIHTYEFGALQSSRFVEPDNSNEIILQIADYDIDKYTGLVATSRDVAGVETNFAYDNMTRLIRTEPSEGAWTIFSYDFPTPMSAALPAFKVEDCPNGQETCGAPLSERQSKLDGLGRLFEESIFYPEGSGVGGSARRFKYDGMARKTRESVWETVDQETKFEYDRFGRVTKIQSVDTALAPTIITYLGERRIDRSDKVATRFPGDEEHYVCFREDYDIFGRLVRVNEDRGSDGSGVCQNQATAGLVTTYTYDQSDRLTSVCAMGTGSACAQERLFFYDNRNFMIAEQHPEIGPTGNALEMYSYDASGNVLSRDIEGAEDFSLRYRYDGANRLIALDEVTSFDPFQARPLKSLHYARTNDGLDKRQGKLVLSKRFNHVDIVSPINQSGILAATISQAYRYRGLDGRVSERQTRYNLDRASYAFTTSYGHDPLGNHSEIRYPVCLQERCAGADPVRSVEFSYTRGFLSEVTGFANNFQYQLGGMLHELKHENDVVETIEPSPKNLMRPDRITTTGIAGGKDWDSGKYLFDASSNVKEIGDQLYTYDRMSRLTVGHVDVDGVLKPQNLTYDPYGNITSLDTDGGLITTEVNTATNRLTGANYDAGGNVTGFTLFGETFDYEYDPLNMMKHLRSNTDQARVFLYDADDRRILTFDCPADDCTSQEARLTATIRALDNKILRTYQLIFGESWQWQRDFVYREDDLLAAVEPSDSGVESTVHFHLDHLGTPRQITDESAEEVAFHSYYPFGAEATDASQNELPLKYTGHERDKNGSNVAGGLDYMHARYSSPGLGRFLSIDPAKSGRVNRPQTWNRYSYNRGNPMKFIDPDGREVVIAQDKKSQKRVRKALVAALQRPRFRATFEPIARAKNFTVTLKAGGLKENKPIRSKLIQARAGKRVGPMNVRFGQVFEKISGGKMIGLDVVFDFGAIAVHKNDTTGVWTMGHEFDHVAAVFKSIQNGDHWLAAWGEASKGDVDPPSGPPSPSDIVGERVFLEPTDLTKAEAEKFLSVFVP